jgi:hypothetical protein
MPDMIDYLDKLRRDLLEQFKEKPNIETLQKALARQLSELYEFFCELETLRSLQNAVGSQLDGIGDIVVLSRAEALVISKLADQNVPMDDETYRLYLAWKISLNTTNCTHKDVYRALKMFWKKPLYYSEDPNYPATMFFKTSTLSPEDNVGVLFLAPKVQAAGVALHISAVTQAPDMPTAVYVAAVFPVSIMTTTLPEPQPGTFDTELNTNVGSTSVEITRLPTLPDVPRKAYLRDATTGAVFEVYISDGTYGIDPAYVWKGDEDE